MNKFYTLCLKCGNVQVRTDIKDFNNKYNVIKDKINCPLCERHTTHVAIKNKKILKEFKDDRLFLIRSRG